MGSYSFQEKIILKRLLMIIAATVFGQ